MQNYYLLGGCERPVRPQNRPFRRFVYKWLAGSLQTAARVCLCGNSAMADIASTAKARRDFRLLAEIALYYCGIV